MTAVSIKAEKRDARESPAALRKAGKMPAVYYGKKQASTPIAVSEKEFAKAFREAGESTVVTLEMPEGSLDSLIYAVDRDPIVGRARHADFYVFEKGQKIKIKVPIEFIGVAPAVKDLGGVLVKVLHEIEIEAAPKDLPHAIAADISPLVDFKSQLLAKQVALPAGVALVTGEDEVVASVYEPKEEMEQPVAAPDLSAIEVEKKGKEAKEGEEGAPEAAAPKSSGKDAGEKAAAPAKK